MLAKLVLGIRIDTVNRLILSHEQTNLTKAACSSHSNSKLAINIDARCVSSHSPGRSLAASARESALKAFGDRQYQKKVRKPPHPAPTAASSGSRRATKTASNSRRTIQGPCRRRRTDSSRPNRPCRPCRPSRPNQSRRRIAVLSDAKRRREAPPAAAAHRHRAAGDLSSRFAPINCCNCWLRRRRQPADLNDGCARKRGGK